MSEKDFFKALAQKTRQEPSPGFDRGFWARFHAEFGPERKVTGWSAFWAGLNTIRLAGAVATVMIVMTASVYYARHRLALDPLQEAGKAGVDAGLLATWKDVDAMSADLTLFQTLDDVALSDSDWEVLLGDEGKDGARS